jgi:hypothetical protein
MDHLLTFLTASHVLFFFRIKRRSGRYTTLYDIFFNWSESRPFEMKKRQQGIAEVATLGNSAVINHLLLA